MAGSRFRIDVAHDDAGWEVKVYDLADHGPDMPYAAVVGPLDQALRSAAHYVLMAACDVPAWGPDHPAYDEMGQ